MQSGDFYGSERSVEMAQADQLAVHFKSNSGEVVSLAAAVGVSEGEVVDAAVMGKAALVQFLEETIKAAKDQGVLWSLHLKATMMKVSDPIMFGHAVRAYYREVFEQYGSIFETLSVDPNNGIGDAYEKIEQLSSEQRNEIKAALDAYLTEGTAQAMVDSDRGITNLHVPSDIIIDASMPAAIRESWSDVGARW